MAKEAGKVRWQEKILAECFKVIDSGGGKVEIIFSFRQPNKIVPIIHTFPDNQTICEEIVIDED
jgi:hypothetical protein